MSRWKSQIHMKVSTIIRIAKGETERIEKEHGKVLKVVYTR
jgi:hypothetical protein